MTENPPPPYQSDPSEAARLKRLLLERLSASAAHKPDTMAALLRDYARLEGLMTDAQVAERLALDESALIRLRLCLRPNSASPTFGDEVQQIATYVGIDPSRLANVVRTVEAIESTRGAADDVHVHSFDATHFAAHGPMMMAARDRSDDERPHVREPGIKYSMAEPVRFSPKQEPENTAQTPPAAPEPPRDDEASAPADEEADEEQSK